MFYISRLVNSLIKNRLRKALYRGEGVLKFMGNVGDEIPLRFETVFNFTAHVIHGTGKLLNFARSFNWDRIVFPLSNVN